MKYLQAALVISFLLGTSILINAQGVTLFSFLNEPTPPRPEFSSILLDGESIAKVDTPPGPLQVDIMKKGVLSVATIDRSGGEYLPVKQVGFKIAIEEYHSNGLSMFSEETYYEIDVEEVLKSCNMGDKIILITVEKRYQLSRHELIVLDDC